MTKERGQMAWEARNTHLNIKSHPWDLLGPAARAHFSYIERAVRDMALEEAAAVCDQWTGAKHTAHDMKTGVFPKQSYAPEALAAAIRAMKEPEA